MAAPKECAIGTNHSVWDHSQQAVLPTAQTILKTVLFITLSMSKVSF